MHTQIDGKEVTITFRHYISPHLTKDGKPFLKTTSCFLTVDGEFYEDVAICSPNDQFNKATGRKIALSHVLSGFPKKFRKKVWKQYFNNLAADSICSLTGQEKQAVLQHLNEQQEAVKEGE